MRRDLLLLLLVLTGGCASAVQEPVILPDVAPEKIPSPLSHVDCARLAVHHAPTVAAWEARLASARAAVRKAARPENPTASLSFENFGLATPVQTTVSIAQALASLAARPRTRSAASHELAATEADLVAERKRLVAAAWRAYDDLVAARRRVEVLSLAESVASDAATAAAKRLAAGEAGERERDLAEAEAAKARADRAAAEGEVRVQEIALCAALGAARPTAIRLSEGLSDLPERSAEQVAEGVKSRPEVSAAAARYAAQRDRSHLAHAGYRFLPTPTGGLRREGSDASALLSLDVEVPLFDDGSPDRAMADAELLAAAAELRRTVREGAFRAAERSARDASARAQRDEHARPLVERRRALAASAERLREAGEVDYDAVVSARRDEAEARAALLDAEAAAARARVDLWEAAGWLDATD